MNLVLFFTRGNSLCTWERGGMLERELALYRWLQAQGVGVSFLTYGGPSEMDFAARLPGIAILCNRWGLPLPLYEWAAPFWFARRLRRASLFKTNQSKGAHTAVLAARLWRKPLLLRAGYSWANTYAQEKGPASPAARLARRLEDWAIAAADAVAVATPALHAEFAARVPAASGKITVLPNSVDTQRFCPQPGLPVEHELVFVGRLAPEKNLPALLEAIQPLAARLAVAGAGPQAAALYRRFGDLDGRVRWLGSVPNTELPALLNRSRIFVLPSHYEGQPKALLEAMACGLAVLGAEAPGIRELLAHGETGWLCDGTPEGLRQAVQTLLADPGLCARLGQNARRFAEHNFALEQVAARELALLQRLTGGA